MLIFKARVRQQSVCVWGGDSMFLLLLLCGKLQFSNILYMHDHLLEKRSWKLTLTTSNLITVVTDWREQMGFGFIITHNH